MAANGNRIKVLFVTRWYPDHNDPQLGVFIQKHAQAAARHCDVSVLYISREEGLRNMFRLDETQAGGVAEFRLYFRPSRSGIGTLDKFFNLVYFFLYYHLASRIIRKKRGKPDLIHAVILGRTAAAAWITQCLCGIPWLVSEHWSGYATPAFAARSSSWKRTVRFLSRRAQTVTAPSRFLEHAISKAGLGGKKFVLPNVVDFPSALQPAPKEVTCILLVADLVDDIKNISGVMKAFGQLTASAHPFRLDIVGDGPDRAKLEALAESLKRPDTTILFHGRVDNETVYRFISGCNFLVMNSNVETFSVICAEALACGRPLVATRCGGPEEFLDDRCALLVQPGDPEGLKQAMHTMAKTAGDYSPEMLQAHVRHFSSESVGRQMEDLYRGILKSR